MTFQRLAELQALLEGVPLPAAKRELIVYARSEGGDAELLGLLERLPDREYRALDDVGEALAPVQPAAAAPAPELPREESDAPPGGDDYLNPNPEPGAVRHDAPPDNPPEKALEQQAKTQNEQQQRQEEMLGG